MKKFIIGIKIESFYPKYNNIMDIKRSLESSLARGIVWKQMEENHGYYYRTTQGSLGKYKTLTPDKKNWMYFRSRRKMTEHYIRCSGEAECIL